jgi:hypothetical protein
MERWEATKRSPRDDPRAKAMKIALLFLLIGTILSLSAAGTFQWPAWAKRPSKADLGKVAG